MEIWKGREEIQPICFVDRDKKIQQMKMCGLSIKPVEVLRSLEYDYIIISLDNWKPIVKILVDEYGIRPGAIRVFYYTQDYKFLTIEDASHTEENEKKDVINELLEEFYESGELLGYKTVVVIGRESEYKYVKDFFVRDNQYDVVHCNEDKPRIIEGGKYLFTSDKHRKALKRYRKDGIIDDWNWNFLPIYDIERGIT